MKLDRHFLTSSRDVTAIGAVVILLSLAADPFLQSVVSYDGRLDAIDLRNLQNPNPVNYSSLYSRIARTERWDAGSLILMG
jgi:hypothetical protein